jgi:hypothetical protein
MSADESPRADILVDYAAGLPEGGITIPPLELVGLVFSIGGRCYKLVEVERPPVTQFPDPRGP